MDWGWEGLDVIAVAWLSGHVCAAPKVTVSCEFGREGEEVALPARARLSVVAFCRPEGLVMLVEEEFVVRRLCPWAWASTASTLWPRESLSGLLNDRMSALRNESRDDMTLELLPQLLLPPLLL